MSEAVTKQGRKTISSSGEPMSAAQRQRRARSFAMKSLCDGNIADVSTSHLISMLPKLIAQGSKNLVSTVCREIMKREGG